MPKRTPQGTPERHGPGGQRRWWLRIPILTCLLATSCTPFDGFVAPAWLLARQMEYLAFATSEPLRPGSIGNLLAHLEREARDPDFSVAPGSVPDDAWDGTFEKIRRLRDTSDFDVLRLLNLLYAFRGHPALSEALWQRAEEAVLTFKYWYLDDTPERVHLVERVVDGETVLVEEPVVDEMWYWTENHILIFRTCEYLAGRLFPDRVFEVTGLTGTEHAERAKPPILAWIEERARFGFTEWHSNVYYDLDMRPLLALVEWAPEESIAQRAGMVLDLVLLDVALHLHRGTLGATHGRSYIKDKASASTENTFDASKLFFDDTELPYSSPSSTSGAVFARARKYRLPEAIRRIAEHDQPMVDRQRMNLPLDEVPPEDLVSNGDPEAPFGLDFRDEANLSFWWSMGAQPAWMMLPLTLEVGERHNLWVAQFEPFAALRDLVWVPGDFALTTLVAQDFAKLLWPLINQSMLKEVNTYTYRTDQYMLSTAQDYRKGVRGSQTHTWQATLGERAMVFTQHPTYLPVAPDQPVPANWNWQREDEPGPGYWSGEASQPRAAQHENVTLVIYAPQYAAIPAIGFAMRPETHAYFPHAHFDEVVQEESWTFGRKGDAYVGLYSWRPTHWRGGQPEVFQNAGLDFDLVADGGAENVWIAECGSLEEWPGGFSAFRAGLLASSVDVTPLGESGAEGFEVAYASPSQGTLALGWDGPLMVNGSPEPLDGYPRMDNPFAHVEFDETRYEVSKDGFDLVLDFATDERRASSGIDPTQAARDSLAELWKSILPHLQR